MTVTPVDRREADDPVARAAVEAAAGCAVLFGRGLLRATPSAMQEIDTLKAENARLRAENAGLRGQQP